MSDQANRDAGQDRRPRNDERWFNQASPEVALKLCSERRFSKKNRDMQKLLEWETHWPFDDSKRTADHRGIALREIIWVVTLLWRHTTSEVLSLTVLRKRITDDPSAPGDVSQLLSEVGNTQPPGFDPDWANSIVHSLIKQTAIELVQKRAVPPGSKAHEVADTIQNVLETTDAQKGMLEAYRALERGLNLSREFTPPQSAKAGQGDKEPKPDVDEDLSHISERIRPYLDKEYSKKWPSSSEIKKLAEEDLFNGLTQHQSQHRVFVLTGAAHAGKTAVLVTLLRFLNPKFTPQLRLPIRESNMQSHDLPILMANAQGSGHRKLSVLILAFLRRLKDPEKSLEEHREQVKIDFPFTRDIDRVEALNEAIREAHEDRPALFIFNNWNDFHPDQNRTLLRDAPKAALIQLLHSSNSRSRFVLSALPDVSGMRLSNDLPRYQPLEVSDPKFREIKRYFREGYPLDAKDARWKPIFDTYGSRQVPGEILLLMAITFQLCEPQSIEQKEEQQKRQKEVLAEIEAYCHACQEGGATASADKLVVLLLSELERRSLLGMVLLVAASDDGVRKASLKRIYENWSEMNFGHEKPNWAEKYEKLEDLRSIAAGFFVKYSRCTHFDKDEFDIDEDSDPKANVWEVDIAISALISKALHRQTEVEAADAPSAEDTDIMAGLAAHARDAQRQLANFVRLRARIKRTKASTTIEPRNINMMRRDMQCHEALLASIPPDAFKGAPDFDPEMLAAKAAQTPAVVSKLPDLLILSEDKVFATDKTFDASRAVRYALLQILRREIDHAHELSMLFDFDLIRLRLYLLMWPPLGRRYDESVDQILAKRGTVLDAGIPDHIRANFTDFEIVELLTTIALAGYHSQRAAVIDWARQQFETLLETRAPLGNPGKRELRVTLKARAVRIYCSLLDSRIQSGAGLLPEDGPKNPCTKTHQETLDELREWLNEDYGAFQDAFERIDSLAEFYREDALRCKAWMRLKAREAELLSLVITPDGYERDRAVLLEAHRIYDMLVALENAISVHAERQYPVIFSGRTARRYIRFLLRSEQFAIPDEHSSVSRDVIDNAIRGLIRINTARLRHYGGADQVSLFLDKALYTFAKGTSAEPQEQMHERKEIALKYAEHALDLCATGSASHAIQLEVLAVLIGQRLEKMRRLIKDKSQKQTLRQLSKETKELIDRMKYFASNLRFGPTFGIALYLEALWDFLDFQLGGQEELDNSVDRMQNLIGKAKETMKLNCDISFAREIHELEGQIRKLRDQHPQ